MRSGGVYNISHAHPLSKMAEKVSRKRCGHCHQNLVIPVYKRHKDLYFDCKLNRWSTTDVLSSDEELDNPMDYHDYVDAADSLADSDSFVGDDLLPDMQGSVQNG